MFFRKTGQGPDLVILHGLFGSSDNWLIIARALENDFTIYLPDFRNHGQSAHTKSHTYHDMTEDLETFFDSCKIKKTIILGHSMGGKVAMMFAALHPEKVKALIIADIAPKSYDSKDHNEEDNELIIDIMQKIDLKAVATRREIDEILAQKLLRTELRQFLLKNIQRDKEGRFRWKINVPVLKEYLPHITQEVNADFFENFKPVSSYPVTFIRGIKSGFIQNTDISLIRSIYSSSTIIDIPGAGHWLHAEKPAEFIEAVQVSLKNL